MRRIAIATKSGVTFYEVKNLERPITLVGSQLYRTDEKFMIQNISAPEEFCLYDYDDIIPYGVEQPPSPDETMSYCDIARSAGRKLSKVSMIPKWLNARNIALAIIGLLIVYQYLK